VIVYNTIQKNTIIIYTNVSVFNVSVNGYGEINNMMLYLIYFINQSVSKSPQNKMLKRCDIKIGTSMIFFCNEMSAQAVFDPFNFGDLTFFNTPF